MSDRLKRCEDCAFVSEENARRYWSGERKGDREYRCPKANATIRLDDVNPHDCFYSRWKALRGVTA